MQIFMRRLQFVTNTQNVHQGRMTDQVKLMCGEERKKPNKNAKLRLHVSSA